MKAAIAYDGHAEGWSVQDVQQVLDVVGEIAAILDDAGHDTVRVPVRPGIDWLAECAGGDVIVNLCEGLGGVSRFESIVAGALELTGTPVTGASARTIAVCHDKPLVNALLAAYDVPIPQWTTRGGGLPDDFPLPAVVKPAAEDASVGIDQRSVVTTREALFTQTEALERLYGRVLVQRYIAGREMAVGFLGQEILPMSEIDFSDLPDDAWPILSFDAKWLEGGPEDRGTQPVCPAAVSPALAERVLAVSCTAWRLVGGSGYGRVDLRIDPDGKPWVIEVNPNPDISADAGLARMGRAGGLQYADLIQRIVALAVAHHAPSLPHAAGTAGEVS